MEIQQAAEKEMKRMKEVMKSLEIIDKSKKAIDFHDFASRYFQDGNYFYEKKQFIESFEAFIISWSYIDAGLKLKFFSVPENQNEWFTA